MSEDNFEKQWKETLDQAKLEPPADLWDKIDGAVANKEVAVYRKKVWLYKWAAVILLLISTTLALPLEEWINGNPVPSENQNSDLYREFEPQGSLVESNQPDKQEEDGITLAMNLLSLNPFLTSSDAMGSVSLSSVQIHTESDWLNDEDGILPLEPVNDLIAREVIGSRRKSLNWEQPTTNTYVQKLSDFRPLRKNKRGASHDEKFKMFAGVDVGSSTYHPNYRVTTNNQLASALASQPQNFVNTGNAARTASPRLEEGMVAGTSYQLGLNLGVKLNNRWTLESG
jgi:hypothetical protein